MLLFPLVLVPLHHHIHLEDLLIILRQLALRQQLQPQHLPLLELQICPLHLLQLHLVLFRQGLAHRNQVGAGEEIIHHRLQRLPLRRIPHDRQDMDLLLSLAGNYFNHSLLKLCKIA
jgi:hypothetical protein